MRLLTLEAMRNAYRKVMPMSLAEVRAMATKSPALERKATEPAGTSRRLTVRSTYVQFSWRTYLTSDTAFASRLPARAGSVAGSVVTSREVSNSVSVAAGVPKSIDRRKGTQGHDMVCPRNHPSLSQKPART